MAQDLKTISDNGNIVDFAKFGLECSHFIVLVFGDLKKYIFSNKVIDLGLKYY